MRIKDEKKYDAIIHASMEQFMEEGFAKASIAKIAKAAGVSPATIYIHFDNKEDLILKLYLHLRKNMSEYILDGIALDGCIETLYKSLWKNYYQFCIDEKMSFNYIMQFTNSPYMDKYQNYGMCYFKPVYELFRVGKEKGLVKKVSDEILFAFTFSTAAQLAKRHDCCGEKLCDTGVDNACHVAWDAIRENGVGIECKKMKMTLNERLMDYFKAGEKEEELIGVEFEHFLVDKETFRSYHYDEKNGQHDIVKKMVKDGWLIDYQENDNIFSIHKNGHYISFEPGGQFEISVKARASIEAIEKDYLAVKAEVESYLTDDQMLVSLGYHPASKIDDLPLLPKERYKLMYEYLHKHGFMARNMMKGTASTQVIVDYKSEEDFVKKYRVANFLSPFLSGLFDAAPVFEGKLYEEENLRIRIWENTDISRCKFPLGVLNKQFGYKDYSNYISDIRPIFIPDGGSIKETGECSLADLNNEKLLSEDVLEHGISMVFPDVRLKKYLEIRMADALPYPLNLAIPSLIKGIFYNESILDKYYEMSKAYNDQDLVRINDGLKKDHMVSCEYLKHNMSCQTFIENLLEEVHDTLDGKEKEYLGRYITFYKKHGSVSKYLKKVHGTKAFTEFLKGSVNV